MIESICEGGDTKLPAALTKKQLADGELRQRPGRGDLHYYSDENEKRGAKTKIVRARAGGGAECLCGNQTVKRRRACFANQNA